MQAELVSLKAELKESEKARIAAEQKVAVLGAELAGFSKAVEFAEKKITAMASAVAKSDEKIDRLETQIIAVTAELASSRTHVQVQQAGLDTAAREIDGLKSKAEKAEKKDVAIKK